MEIQKTVNEQKKESIYPKLDYTIKDIKQRNNIVHNIVNSLPSEKLTPYYLEQLARYLTETTESKKNKTILTNNRMVTVNKREKSFQGLVNKLENGEDGIYNFMTGGDKNILFVPKIGITEEDIKTIPGLKELRDEIQKVEIKQKIATGKKKYLLTKQLIQMRQDQYVLKSAYKPAVAAMKLTKSSTKLDLRQNIKLNEKNEPVSDCAISFFNPDHICCLLCNYSKLKEAAWGNFQNDLYYLMEDLDKVIDKALKYKYPFLYDILIYKIDGLQNKEIIKKIQEKHNITYSIEYLSSIWRKKIPKLIAQQAKKDWIVWYYTNIEYGKWKRCSRCHEIKLAHPYFFTKNKTSKDGWYSLCKECRNKK